MKYEVRMSSGVLSYHHYKGVKEHWIVALCYSFSNFETKSIRDLIELELNFESIEYLFSEFFLWFELQNNRKTARFLPSNLDPVSSFDKQIRRTYRVLHRQTDHKISSDRYQLHLRFRGPYFIRNEKLLETFKILSNNDHKNTIPFCHFAIVLTSWYRQHPNLCREDLRSAIMMSWDTRCFPAKMG